MESTKASSVLINSRLSSPEVRKAVFRSSKMGGARSEGRGWNVGAVLMFMQKTKKKAKELTRENEKPNVMSASHPPVRPLHTSDPPT